VVVTGAGIITALGRGWEANAAGFQAGRPAFGPVTLFDVSRQRAKLAAEVSLPENLPANDLTPARRRRLDRASRLLLWAAGEALEASQWGARARIPVVLGTTSGGMSLGETYYRHAISHPESNRGQATRVTQYQAQQQTANLAAAYGLNGPVTLIANACASGANAIGHAWDLVRSGRTDCVVAGGYEALCQMVFAGFDALQALSLTQCRPFDAKRDGLALGEGAAVLTLESLEYAQARGASILAELVGYGAVTDSHHLTQPHPTGDAAFAAMTAACAVAGVTPAQIDYVNAHGTGTPLNDTSEAAAINRWAGPRAATLPVSSTKASVGHLLGAAGAVEAVISLMALQGQWLPPTTTLRELDPACQFPVVTALTRTKVEYVLSNSFGFGGSNASLVFRRWS
jgi:3-oxoacyl-[acyl-carrier-protein] synthase II